MTLDAATPTFRTSALAGSFGELSMVEKASMLAAYAHQGQIDQAEQPYINHVARVAATLAAQHHDEETVAAAWLRDVVRDTYLSLQDLRNGGFSHTVIAAVAVLTRHEGEREHDFYQRVNTNVRALHVKRADVIDVEMQIRSDRVPAPVRVLIRQECDRARAALFFA